MTSELSLFLCTWNVGEVTPPDSIRDLLHLEEQYDLYAIGIQELAHTALDLFRDSIFDDPWTLILTELFHSKGYIRVDSVRLLGVHLAVFVRQSLLYVVQGFEKSFTRTGFGGYWGNKGAVTVRMDVSGVSICIVNSHLTAHLSNVAQRIRDYDMIIESQTFCHPDTKTILDHDYVFWMGDLNFRLDDVSHAEVYKCIRRSKIDKLKPYDQLTNLLKEDVIFLNFEEGPIRFNPTYKFDYGTNVYDTSPKNRKPGWCDRILWYVHENSIDNVPLGVKQLHYKSHPMYLDSDHKPVSASFIIKVSHRKRDTPVVFDFIPMWSSDNDGLFSYTVATELPITKWDWIAMYRADFTHFNDYVTWIWAPVEEDAIVLDTGLYFSVVLNHNYLVGQSNDFILGYFSETRKAVMGFSNIFKVQAS